MRDKSVNVIEKTNESLSENIINSGERLKEIVEETEKVKNKANRELKSYFDRHRIIDYLIYINLIITPVLFFIVLYIIFWKR